jgi:hypothetical protein
MRERKLNIDVCNYDNYYKLKKNEDAREMASVKKSGYLAQQGVI